MSENSPRDFTEMLAQHADCDWNTRIDSGLEALDPEGIRRVIQTAERPVVIKFGKSFCGWTKKLNRALQDWVPAYRAHADFYEADLPTHESLYEEWRLPTSPMMLLFKAGKEVARSDAAEAHEVPPVFEAWFGPAKGAERA